MHIQLRCFTQIAAAKHQPCPSLSISCSCAARAQRYAAYQVDWAEHQLDIRRLDEALIQRKPIRARVEVYRRRHRVLMSENVAYASPVGWSRAFRVR